MPISRRDFVRSGATAVAISTLPGKLAWGAPRPSSDPLQLDALALRADTDQMRSLAMRAIDAARSAGAEYADVRITRSVAQAFEHEGQHVVGASVADGEELAVGIRALVKGYWGFAASPYWDSDEVVMLAKEAVGQAKTNALGTPRQVDWGTIPAATGSWTTPGIDPFTITVEEKIDFMNAWRQAVNDAPKQGLVVQLEKAKMNFTRQERFMASTEGAAILQILYGSAGSFPFRIAPDDWRAQRDGRSIEVGANGLQMQRTGWNGILDANIRDQIPTLFETGRELLALQRKPTDVGRYDVVFDAPSVANLIGQTFGIATQLDRALGLEANAGGTSYLGPEPTELLGSLHVAAPMINITANRSLPGGCATVKWDDEGVTPDEFTLVKDGVLVDYQTTREQAGWLKSWYEKQNQPVRSRGCAASDSALENTIQQPPNLALTPANTSATFESLVAGTSRGLAVMNGWVSTDFQAKNGTGGGLVREIVDGKLGKVCTSAGFLFSSLEFWKNVSAIGDATSAQTQSITQHKGQPVQRGVFSVSAVPMSVKNVSIIDLSRRA